MRALIIDGRYARGSLAAVRGLARGGWDVGVAAPEPNTPAGLSRHARRHEVPLPEAGLREFLAAVSRAIDQGGYEVVFASSDADMLVLARERDRIPAHVPFPAYDVLLRSMDKGALSETAERIGLSAPPRARTASEARERFGAVPVIVKERLHGATGRGGRPTHVNPLVSADAHAIEDHVTLVREAGAEPMIQPVVHGELMAFSSVVDEDGRMLARVQQVAERTWPDGQGCSVRARTVRVDEQLAERVGALLRELGWQGLSELQFLLPEGEGGGPQLIDFNGRFYGSMSLAIGAGVNLPDLWARLATGRPIQGGGDARPGARYQWLVGDLRAGRDAGLGLRGALDSARYAIGARHSISSLSDPRPGLHELHRLVRRR